MVAQLNPRVPYTYGDSVLPCDAIDYAIEAEAALPRLGGPVTSFQHSFIVSEHGAAVIWGYDAPGQAGQIIDHVAHPSVREQLREAGLSLGLCA